MVQGNDAQLEGLQKELLKRENGKVDFDDIADEIGRLRELKQDSLAESDQREGMKQRIAEITKILDEQTGAVEELRKS